MKALLVSPFYNISTKVYSHKSAQAFIYADMIKQLGNSVDIQHGDIKNYNSYDIMYVYHGNDFFGSLNLFGGLKGFGGLNELIEFSKFKGKVVSLGIEFPEYHEMIKSRFKNDVPEKWYEVDLDNIERMYKEAEHVVHFNNSTKLVAGDSHAICMYRPGWIVNSVPFKTLSGALKMGLNHFTVDYLPDVKEVELYFGNIDIRHHLCRLGSPNETVPPLVKAYVEAANNLPVEKVSIYEPLPIEDESRKIPKSGHYKRQPFWGTWAERNLAKDIFLLELEEQTVKNRVEIKYWTNYLTDTSGKLDFKHMEKPRSVHLSRGSYPHWTGEEASNNLEDFFG